MSSVLKALVVVLCVLVLLASGLATLKYTARPGLPNRLPPPLPDADSAADPPD